MDEVNPKAKKGTKTHPLVIALYEEDDDRIERILFRRRAARPEGAPFYSRSHLFRDLLREADAPAEMTEGEHQR